MATNQQNAANRANAKKSTGPQTPEGRAAVRLNAVKHGLSAKTVVVMGEDPKQFEALWDSLLAEHQPAIPTEEILVRHLAVAAWRQLRLFRMEAGFFRIKDQANSDDEDYEDLPDDERLASIVDDDAAYKNVLLNYHRFDVHLDRSIRGAIQELRRCRAERLAKSAKQTQSEPKPQPCLQLVEVETTESTAQPLTPNQEPDQNGPIAA